MSIPDSLLEEWFRLGLPLPGAELEDALQLCREDPYRAKRRLGRKIVELFHGVEAADSAEAHFDRLFRDRAAPDEVPEIRLSAEDPRLRYDPDRGVWLAGLLVAAGFAASNGEALRLIDQGAVAVDDDRVGDRNAFIRVEPGVTRLLKRGKRHYVRFTVVPQQK